MNIDASPTTPHTEVGLRNLCDDMLRVIIGAADRDPDNLSGLWILRFTSKNLRQAHYDMTNPCPSGAAAFVRRAFAEGAVDRLRWAHRHKIGTSGDSPRRGAYGNISLRDAIFAIQEDGHADAAYRWYIRTVFIPTFATSTGERHHVVGGDGSMLMRHAIVARRFDLALPLAESGVTVTRHDCVLGLWHAPDVVAADYFLNHPAWCGGAVDYDVLSSAVSHAAQDDRCSVLEYLLGAPLNLGAIGNSNSSDDEDVDAYPANPNCPGADAVSEDDVPDAEEDNGSGLIGYCHAQALLAQSHNNSDGDEDVAVGPDNSDGDEDADLVDPTDDVVSQLLAVAYCAAARAGCINVLQWLVARTGELPPRISQALVAAVQAGQLEAVVWLAAQLSPTFVAGWGWACAINDDEGMQQDRISDGVAVAGVFDWLIRTFPPATPHAKAVLSHLATKYASANLHMPVLAVLLRHGVPIDDLAWYDLAWEAYDVARVIAGASWLLRYDQTPADKIYFFASRVFDGGHIAIWLRDVVGLPGHDAFAEAFAEYEANPNPTRLVLAEHLKRAAEILEEWQRACPPDQSNPL